MIIMLIRKKWCQNDNYADQEEVVSK